jgi:alpha-glucosidase
LEGRHKLLTQGFTCPGFALEKRLAATVIDTGTLKTELHPELLRLSISQLKDRQWVTALQDRETGAYYRSNGGQATRHYQFNSNEVRHFGLGDKTGPLDRSGRRYRMLQLDALGYNAEISDPLYKHIPFVIIQDKGTGAAVGVLYDCMAEMVFDLGCERSNYHQSYRYIEAQEKGLCYYVIAGPRISDVVKRLSRLTGKPHFQPRWSMGFAFTSMHHADHPNAQQEILSFAKQCRELNIPISAIHFGSGYTTRKGLRYVFTWNEDKFPDKKAMFAALRSMGLRTVANTKPMLLLDHPAYAENARKGAFICSGDRSPAVSMFWDAEGSHLDFTAQAGLETWKQGVETAVLGAGFDAVWNDNNEVEIWDENAMVAGFGTPMASDKVHPLQSLLMTRYSFEVSSKRNPNQRPYTITRAGCLGIQRYAETWTGDNYTSWHTLKWNLRNGLSLGLSGIPFVGHDIGGFAGPKPEPELLIRWVQMMALHPRCLINSWKPQLDDPVNLPWMHGDATDIIRQTLELRYRLLPYLYTLAYQTHKTGEPILRPVFYDYPDPQSYEERDCFLVGKDLLVAPVVEPGDKAVSVYLPRNAYGWYDFHTQKWYAGGQAVEVSAELDRLPILIQAGAVIPMAITWAPESPHDAQVIELVCYSPRSTGSRKSCFFYDDGVSWNHQKDPHPLISMEIKADNSQVRLVADHPLQKEDCPNTEVRFIGTQGRKTMVASAESLL